MGTNKTKMIKTDAGEFVESRLSIRMPKPMWRALNTIAHEMRDRGIPVKCPIFGNDDPSIASVIRAIVMSAGAMTLVRIGSARSPSDAGSVADTVERYIAAGYGQNSAIPAVVDGRDGPKPAIDGQSDADHSETPVNRD